MFDGVIPPLITPFTGDELDEPSVAPVIGMMVDAGVRGVLANGTNGEAPFVDQDEADRLVESVRAALPADRTLLVGTGRDSTRATIEACRRAALLGADAVLVRPPAVFPAQMTEAALDVHFRAVADTSPAPVMIYNHPVAFGVSLSAAFVSRLAAHDNVCGVKESSGNVGLVGEHAQMLPEGRVVVSGVASTAYASLLVGAAGVILAVANVVPGLCVRLYDLVRRGDLEEALRLQRAITPLGHAVTTRYGIAGLKAAMTLAGMPGTSPRRPLLPVPPEAIDELHRLMTQLAAATGEPILATRS